MAEEKTAGATAYISMAMCPIKQRLAITGLCESRDDCGKGRLDFTYFEAFELNADFAGPEGN